ncbi:MAG: hypothetical protein HRU31_11425 [Rhodobacteraceae bacterium]|nr:hypothetical protein [Paracoccaceae bacterium]
MQIHEVDFRDAAPVEGYGPGFFRIGGDVQEGPLLAIGAQFGPWSGLEDRDVLLALAGQVDVLFVGTGSEIAHLPPDLRRALEEAGIGVEVMNSPSACRTYNVVLTEGRRVALAALPI